MAFLSAPETQVVFSDLDQLELGIPTPRQH